ncbi:hypothetical protein CUR178_03069 [Leishmania enriettii]|uniref:ER membrane protein complex subunit 4 n=1 Tax=Leishmania enriettii TaxID=5663 RepID=A0A836KGE9_LEIEN|nr:hypothetical protein CUR178_03069 [Leishmania enriettii]
MTPLTPLSVFAFLRLRVLDVLHRTRDSLSHRHLPTHTPTLAHETQISFPLRLPPLLPPPCICSYTRPHRISGTVHHRLPLAPPLLLHFLPFGSEAMVSTALNANAAAKQMTDEEITRHRIMTRLSDIRTQPLKQLPMTAFMMWMVGNDVSIFSIMFVGMAVVNPLQSILGAGKMFADFEEDAKTDRQVRSAVNQARWIYIGCCLIAFLVALVKLNWMELLPVNSMDWMDHTPPTYQELSIGTFYH